MIVVRLDGRYVLAHRSRGRCVQHHRARRVHGRQRGARLRDRLALRAHDLYDANGALQLHFTQSNDVFTLTHPSYQARELKRSGPTAWAFNLVTVVPTQPAPTLPVATPTLGGAVNYTYA
jgi:hypothetical protein